MTPSAILATALVQVEPYLQERGDVWASFMCRNGRAAAATDYLSGVRAVVRECLRSARVFRQAAAQFAGTGDEAAYLSEAESLIGLAVFLRHGAAAMGGVS